jgi:ABC-type polysaccharide/polyol phosphate transport system ATPase subunit
MNEIILDHVSVEIPLRGLRTARGEDPRIARKRGGLAVRALCDVSFVAKAGDRIGVLGPNGAGKTTLLRVLAGIVPKTSGKLHVVGQVHAIFNLGDGMRFALTGRENARLRYYLLGEPNGSAGAFINNVRAFADLGDFFDLPINTYSPGMLSRLVFAMGTIKHADVLLLDEWIGVADLTFQKKAADRLHDLISRNDIFIIASHNRDILRETTDRVLVMANGIIADVVDSKDIVGITA